MCGIVGFINQNKVAECAGNAELLDRMCALIRHRGPDEQGTLLKGPAALGMRRLSIIDLACGQQPIFNEAGNLAIVFNGEIYNYRELKKQLEACGHTFKTNSDTETIVHAYEEYGARCVEHLRGMFAFAIWDEQAEKLFIARDRTGKKPLYYCLSKEKTFVFGSELKSLIEHPEFKRELDPAALDAYLAFGYVPDPLCIFKGVHKLPPAHTLEFENGTITTESYWDFKFEISDSEFQIPNQKNDDSSRHDETTVIAGLQAELEEAVRVRLVSEVPLGAFLSGGVDSSAIVGMMSKIMDKPVKTFSIGFNEDSYDELKYARIAAKHFNTEHHEFVVTPDVYDVVDQIVWHFDEPFADQSAFPTFMLAKMAREHVTVVLSGDGGDELFAGYTRYRIDQQRGGSQLAKLPQFVRQNVLQPVSAALPHGARGKNWLRNVALDPIERYIDSVSLIPAANRRRLYSRDFQNRLNGGFAAGERLFGAFANTVETGDALDRLLYLDSKTYLPGDILTKVDRMTMAASLEARVPLLDHKLIDYVVKLPSDLKMREGTTKYIFKRALENLVPNEILNRPKQGFGVPLDVWLNQQLGAAIREILLEPRTLQRGIFEPKYIRLMIDEHERRRRDHSAQLGALWLLELWQRRFVDA